MQFGGAKHLAVLDIGDHHRAIGKAARRIGFDKALIGRAVEPVAPALGIEPQEMLPQQRHLARGEVLMLPLAGSPFMVILLVKPSRRRRIPRPSILCVAP